MVGTVSIFVHFSHLFFFFLENMEQIIYHFLNIFFLWFQKKFLGSSSLLHNLDVKYETATFGMGCFWGADALFGATNGVLRTKVGYSGGTKANPDYKNL